MGSEEDTFIIVRMGDNAPFIKRNCTDIMKYLKELCKNYEGANIHVVTYLHGGVGGQWVQDAREYLYMFDPENDQ